MSEFKNYKRTQISEMRLVTLDDITHFNQYHCIDSGVAYDVSISDADVKNGSPKLGDMIARNPKDHNDQWLVAKQYFEDNFTDMN